MKKNLIAVKFVCCMTMALFLAGCMTAQYYAKKGEENSKFEKSVEYFEKALELEPDNVEIKKSFAVKYIPEIRANSGEKRKRLFEKAIALDPDNLDIYYANAYAVFSKEKQYSSVNLFEELLEKDPKYKVKPNDISVKGSMVGLKNVNKVPLGNCSLHFLVGTLYFDAANDKDSKLSSSEKNNLVKKSLENLLAGMEIDITQKQNDTQEARTAYWLQIARTFELSGDYETAIDAYTAFLNDSSIKLDKTGISGKRQELNAQAKQQPPAVASGNSSGSSSSSGQRPQAVDMTGKADFTADVGGVYKLSFSAEISRQHVAIQVPPYIKSVTVSTEGNLDTVMELAENDYSLMETFSMLNPKVVERLNIVKKPTDAVFTDNQSSTNLNARVVFPSIPQGNAFFLDISEKNGKTGTYTLVIQGTR